MKTIFRLLLLIFIWSSLLHAQWMQTGLMNTDVLALAVIDTNLFAGTKDSIYLSTDNGTSWMAISVGLTNTLVQALVVLDTNLFAGTRDGVFLSTNYGASWAQLNLGWPWPSIRAFAISGTNIFAGSGGNGVFRSTNKGSNWTQAGLSRTNVRSLAVSPNASGGFNLFAGTNGSGVFLSNDSAANWTETNNGLTYSGVLSLAVSGTNLIAGTWGGIFISTNNGTSWTEASTGLTYTYVYCLAASGTNLFAGTWDGIFLSIDNGSSWIAANTGLSNTDVFSLAVLGNNLFAGTDGGVWRRPLSELITSAEGLSAALPRVFNLSQNYPNPFNPSTRIRFSLTGRSNVNIEIYSITGQVIKSLTAKSYEQGTYEIEWDGKNMNGKDAASGMYIYKMTVRNPETTALRNPAVSRTTSGQVFIKAKKMLLVR